MLCLQAAMNLSEEQRVRPSHVPVERQCRRVWVQLSVSLTRENEKKRGPRSLQFSVRNVALMLTERTCRLQDCIAERHIEMMTRLQSIYAAQEGVYETLAAERLPPRLPSSGGNDAVGASSLAVTRVPMCPSS